jgi:hypothetical protein
LYQILKKSSAPLWLFDKLISFHEKNSRMLQKQKNIPSHKALLHTLNSLIPVPKAEGIPLAMETGNEELASEGYQCLPQHTIIVQRWLAYHPLLQEYLLDLDLFGNKQYLVNAHNPFAKYISTNDVNDRELIAGHWYSRTYDIGISDPSTESLLVLEIYLDKTGWTAGLGSY